MYLLGLVAAVVVVHARDAWASVAINTKQFENRNSAENNLFNRVPASVLFPSLMFESSSKLRVLRSTALTC